MIDLFLTSFVLLIALATMQVTTTASSVRHINLAVAAEFAITVGFAELVSGLPDGSWFDAAMAIIHLMMAYLFVSLNGLIQARISAIAAGVSIFTMCGLMPVQLYFSTMMTIQIMQIYYALRGFGNTFTAWQCACEWRRLYHMAHKS